MSACGCKPGVPCGCCQGTRPLAPAGVDNRPQLPSLAYRAGTHGTFLATMLARLSDSSATPPNPLDLLRTRDPADPSVALMDGWALVGDVLTFYTERIANEGFLRTAAHRLSLVELARLVGYRPRPGVSASTYLAFTLDAPPAAASASLALPGFPPPAVPPAALPPNVGADDLVVIPAGTRAQTQPAQGELPQPFETAEALTARAAWNALRPRMTRPQRQLTIPIILADGIWLSGVSTKLKPNDPLLVDFPEGYAQVFRTTSVDVDAPAGRTFVRVELWDPTIMPFMGSAIEVLARARLARIAPLLVAAAEQRGRNVQAFLAAIDYGERQIVPHIAAGSTRPKKPGLPDAFFHIAPPATASADFREALIAWMGIAANELSDIGELLTHVIDRATLAEQEQLKQILSHPAQRPVSLANPAAPVSVKQLLGALDTRGTRAVRATRGADLTALLAAEAARSLALVGAFMNDDARRLHAALSALADPRPQASVYAFRVETPLFAASAPLRPIVPRDAEVPVRFTEWTKAGEYASAVFLGGSYPEVPQRAWILIDRAPEATEVRDRDAADDDGGGVEVPSGPTPPATALAARYSNLARLETRVGYGVSSPVTYVALNLPWFTSNAPPMSLVRRTRVYAQAERLALAQEPVTEAICPGTEIALDALHDGLEPGRFVVVTGHLEPGGGVPPGVPAPPHLARLASVTQRHAGRPGDTAHTYLTLDPPVPKCLARATVVIYGNVARATHGETRVEVLGAGDAAVPNQRFPLRQTPLTYVAAATPAGAESTLEVRVNDVLWHERPHLLDAGPADHVYATTTGDENRVAVVFGDGVRGARPPTAAEVRAVYRTGLGAAGNVAAGRGNLLATRPLGVREVTNPLPATGGADPEPADLIRRNAPVGLIALDRLVSVRDYEDFARGFAGIEKAAAALLGDGDQTVVHVTIAGRGDVPIEPASDLFRNLLLALRTFGDASTAVRVDRRRLVPLVLVASVRVGPEYLWSKVEPQVRDAIDRRFGFEARGLAEGLALSRVVAVIQEVPGVEYVDVDTFGGLHGLGADGQPVAPEDVAAAVQSAAAAGAVPRVVARPARFDFATGEFVPAELCCFVRGVADAVVLTEVPR
jgi:predicted phage baseplate assembly protein